MFGIAGFLVLLSSILGMFMILAQFIEFDGILSLLYWKSAIFFIL